MIKLNLNASNCITPESTSSAQNTVIDTTFLHRVTTNIHHICLIGTLKCIPYEVLMQIVIRVANTGITTSFTSDVAERGSDDAYRVYKDNKRRRVGQHKAKRG
jgi:hypothetical protein